MNSASGPLEAIRDRAPFTTTTVRPRHFNFSDDSYILIPEERRLIVLYEEVPCPPIEQLLGSHPRVVYLGDITDIQPQHLKRFQQNPLSIVTDIFRCSQQSLSYFVEYANSHMLKQHQPAWCGSNRRLGRQGRIINYSSCVAVRRSAVKSFCEQRHIAVKTSDISRLDGIAQDYKANVKVLHLTLQSINNKSMNSYRRPTPEGPDFTYSYIRQFDVSDWQKEATKRTAVIELYNFLDLYFEEDSILIPGS